MDLTAFKTGSATRTLGAWLAGRGVSLAVAVHGAVAMIGQERGEVAINTGEFDRPLGIAASEDRLFLACRDRVWMLTLRGDVYVPRVAHITGDVDAHELVVDRHRRPIFAATRYSCLATLSPTHGIAPMWSPPFISQLVPEDRCHLNGVGMEHGTPRYVTAFKCCDAAEGWGVTRKERSGVVLDLAHTGRAVSDGRLVMPHSPRVHNGKLYVLDSGAGYLCAVDRRFGELERVAFLPGFARGLIFVDDFAVITLSKPRGEFDGLPLGDELRKRNAAPWAGVAIVDLKTGGVTEWLRLGDGIEEAFDVALLAHRKPQIMSPSADIMRTFVEVDPAWQPLDLTPRMTLQPRGVA